MTLFVGALLGLPAGILIGAYITGLGLKHHTHADGSCSVEFEEK